MDKRIIDALSSCSTSSRRAGNTLAKSVNISVSRERRHRAASRDFSFRFSLFLQAREGIILIKYLSRYLQKIKNIDKDYELKFIAAIAM